MNYINQEDLKNSCFILTNIEANTQHKMLHWKLLRSSVLNYMIKKYFYIRTSKYRQSSVNFLHNIR